MPWNDLAQDGIYYDNQKFSLPYRLITPGSLELPQLYGLAQYFSGRPSADPFVFRDQAEVARLLGNARALLNPVAQTELEVEQTENSFGKPREDVPAADEVHVPPNEVPKKRGRPPKVQSDFKIPSPKKLKPNPVDITRSSTTPPERPKRVIPPKKSSVKHDSRAKVKPGFEIRLYAYDEKGNRGEEIREQRQPNHGKEDCRSL
ncbi:hypothetical protein GGX14DRAFT_558383 [Mycena pura]|uniref:Uncharacterized protein n=1 Tax=Mycena pura TaxID=153505 RepID=A0AAD6VTI3_9AGAR|nr:hypothetical protein GGX14DRAFT_558383 [Mycena pura]